MDYSQNIEPSDIDHYYFRNYSQFKFAEDDNSSRIKSLEYTDEQEKITYTAIFAYDQIGISFTISSEDSKERASIFNSSLTRAISGYKNFIKHFLNENCPKSLGVTLSSKRLLISLYGFLEDLNPSEQEKLLHKIKSSLKEYTPKIRVILNDQDDFKESIRPLTLRELEDMQRFDFDIIIIVPKEVYLYVGHHLFAKWFILEDPSLSLQKVATWGFISSLKLKDLHYEIEDFYEKIERIKANLDRKERSWIPIGLGLLQEQLIELEREQIFIEDDLREFTTLSDKIYESIKKNERSNQIRHALELMDSLPHSIFQAYGILEMKQLGRFANFKRSLVGLSSQLKKLEAKFNKRRIVIFPFFLAFIAVITTICRSALDISYLADVLQILTFIVAFVILVLRFPPTQIRSRTST